MKNLFQYILLIFTLAGCDLSPGPESTTPYVLEGTINYDCSAVPYANKSIRLWQDYVMGLSDDYGGILAETTTDASGHFKFTYTRKNYSYYPQIQTEGGYDIMTIPWDTNINDLESYITPICNIQVSINVINPHIEGDTLIIGDFRTLGNLSVACPLTSGIIYTAENFPLLTMYYNGEPKRINWFITPYNDNTIYQDFIIDKYCGDTVYLSVDIY